MTRQEALALLKNEIDELFYNRWHKAPAMREALTVLESALNLPRPDITSTRGKTDWIAENFDGPYEMFIDPVALFDAIHGVNLPRVDAKNIDLEAEYRDGFNGEHYQYLTGQHTMIILGLELEEAERIRKALTGEV